MNDQTHPVLHEVPIGIRADGKRRETDAMGEIEVPADRYWGAQTQRSLVGIAVGIAASGPRRPCSPQSPGSPPYEHRQQSEQRRGPFW